MPVARGAVRERVEPPRMDTVTQQRLNPDDLVTHGVILGMTGSGKTGLGIGLLEELALSGVPLIVVDLKGDLTNLALVTNEQRALLGGPPGTNPSWVGVKIYTPGSEVGRPISVLGSLAPPASGDRADLITGTVLGLLNLVGKKADALQDPEPILMSQILDVAWSKGETLSLEGLITQVVDPPFARVGVFPVDTFMPSEKRLALARQLNGILAAPSFGPWTKGEGLDVAEFVKTPISIFYLAHLSDQERMFFLTLLLERVLAWSRTLSGSSKLKALLYFDEVAGYLPPHPYDPPTKKPVMTLLKQARGVGLGVVLSTQNPVDVDYKAMSNAGSWWIGKLQTSQDRDRVAEGLKCPREQFDQLEKRIFLYKPPGSDQLQLIRTRDTLAWLRGPLTLSEVGKVDHAAPVARVEKPVLEDAPGSSAPPPLKGLESSVLDPRAVFSSRLEGHFEKYAEPARQDGKLRLSPALYARVAVRFDEEKTGFLKDHVESRVYFPLSRGIRGDFVSLELEQDDLLAAPDDPAVYDSLPTEFDELKEWEAAKKTILDDIYRNMTRGQWINARLKLYGQADESREAFEERCRKVVEEKIAARADKLRQANEKKAEALAEKVRAQKAKVAQKQSEASSRKTESFLGVGETLLGFFTGRKRSLKSVVSGGRMAANADQRAQAAADDLDALQEKVEQLAAELQDELDRIRTEEERALDGIEERPVRLDKEDVRLADFRLLWVPVTRRV